MSPKHKIELITALILLGGGVVGLLTQVLSKNPLNQQPATTQDSQLIPGSRFYCSKAADSQVGGEVWTVMYNHAQGTKPWLRMVRFMGGDFDPQKRCEEIARRLDIFSQQGLINFDFRTDANTPKQYVLCAKTKISGNDCPLVLTLMPKDDPYKALHEVAGALLPGTLPSYQCNNPQNCPPLKPLAITLQDQL